MTPALGAGPAGNLSQATGGFFFGWRSTNRDVRDHVVERRTQGAPGGRWTGARRTGGQGRGGRPAKGEAPGRTGGPAA